MANLINNLGGAVGFGENVLTRNDDSYKTGVDLRTIFGASGLNFFGTTYNYVSVNNNGNVTLSNNSYSGLSTYTPFGLATGNYPIIAPFFADVDTRLSAGGEPLANQVTPTPGGTSRGSDIVWYDMDATGNGKLTVTWDDVGYYSYKTDKLNAFQLQIIGRGNGNFDIVFRYEAVNWTTGGASGGVGGLGGTVARAGYSTGDGASWYELPQSGQQDPMLALETTPGNTGSAGLYQFSVRSGTSAGETINGTANSDLLAGAGGNDTINGLAGDDYLIGNDGADLVRGGSGDDTYSTEGLDTIVESAGAGTDTVMSSATFTLGANLENLRLTGTSAINGTGNALNNVLAGNSADNVLNGGSGTDTVDYSLVRSGITIELASMAAQYVYGYGYDTLRGIESVIGTIYGDNLKGTSGSNVLNGNLGSDTMAGGNGSDTYYVDNAYDVVTEATAGATGGSDWVYSSLDAYTLGANVENGRILSSGAANMTGNALANTIMAGSGNNVLVGGAGVDTLSYAAGVNATTGVTMNLSLTTVQATGGSGSDRVSGFENLIGSSRADKLTGSNGANVLTGGAGNDTIAGGGGNDRLVGEAGADRLNGGTGADIFDYNGVTESGITNATRDVISGFVRGQDRIDLSTIDAIASTATNNAFTFIGTRAFSAAGQVRYVYDAASGTGTLYGNTDADSTAEFSVQLTGVTAFAAADLIL